ncbi:MAG: helix-turn-helix domain-containing protein [Treponema sp.]|jgi:predicted transcriptional regulator|nr:helix-turn-helix domain-containing protein [Treponema sp.]
MAKNFSELLKKMNPERRAKIDAEVKKTLAEMPLQELRNARGLSQVMLAEALHIQQPAIAKLEKRTDMYISTLRSHIRAMGGELDIIARFPDGDVRISNFSQI